MPQRRLVVFILGLLLVGTAYAAGKQRSHSVIDSGGGPVASGDLLLQSSLGQPIAGRVSNGTAVLFSGATFHSGQNGFTTPTAEPDDQSTPSPTSMATATVSPTPTPSLTSTPTPEVSGESTATPIATALPESGNTVFLPAVSNQTAARLSGQPQTSSPDQSRRLYLPIVSCVLNPGCTLLSSVAE